MPPVPLVDHAGLTEAERDDLRGLVAGHEGLDQILAWGRSQSPAIHPLAAIQQDEFTHDVVVALPGGRWLVYGIT
jgi:hypothetical protein